jgi:hypothetical protein
MDLRTDTLPFLDQIFTASKRANRVGKLLDSHFGEETEATEVDPEERGI